MKSPGFSVGFLVLYWVNCCFINENYCSIGYIYVHSPVPRDTPQKNAHEEEEVEKLHRAEVLKGIF